MKKFIIIFFTFFVCFNLNASIERRGAIDIGSGRIKLLVADVDTETNTIVENIYSESAKVPLSEDLSTSLDGTFSPAIQLQAKKVVADLMQSAEIHRATKLFGIATEAFRLAHNGPLLASEISETLGIPIRVISQEEEAELGFLSAVKISGEDPEHAVVWDIGGGSFQISWKESNKLHSYMASFGKIPVRNLIIAKIKHEKIEPDSTPNPISLEVANDALALLHRKFEEVPDSLQEKMQNPLTKVLGVGAVHHSNIAFSSGSNVYTLDMVDALLLNRLGLDDEAIGNGASAKYWVSDLILIKAVMSHLGFKEVIDAQSFGDPEIPAPGNTIGIVTTPSYWDALVPTD